MRWIIARVKGSKTISVLAGKEATGESFKERNFFWSSNCCKNTEEIIGNFSWKLYVIRLRFVLRLVFWIFFDRPIFQDSVLFFWSDNRSDRVLTGLIRMEFGWTNSGEKKFWRRKKEILVLYGSRGRDLATDNRIIRSSDGGWKESGDLSKKAGIVAISFVSNEDTFLTFIAKNRRVKMHPVLARILHESIIERFDTEKKKRTIRLSFGEHGDREDWKRRRDTVKENRLTVARANEILIKTLLKRVERFARSCREKEIAGGTPIIRPRNRPTANEYLPTNHQVYLTFQSKRR